MSIVAATLSLPYAAKFITVSSIGFDVEVSAPLPAALISFFGIAFLIYSFYALGDLRYHIKHNWARANYARTYKPREDTKSDQPKSSENPNSDKLEQSMWEGPKRHGWYVLLTVGGLAFLAFAGQFVLACRAVL